MSTNPPVDPAEQFMVMAAAAVSLHRLYDSYVSAGFTEVQAMQLVMALIAGAVGVRS